ncbi:MAG: SDR family oxidoreductase [Candidatus Promineifilaceae bacterium]
MKVAIVTGVSRRIGIGAAIARTLAEAGTAVFTTYYRPYDASMAWGSKDSEAESILAELREMGVPADGAEADLSNPAIPARLIEQARQRFGHIDILVNNATHDEESTLEEMDADNLDRHYAVNMRGPLLLCREFARVHDGRPGGRIINMTSGQSLTPMPGNLPYAATKGAIEAATMALSAALAPKKITVNAVDPGATDTGWMSDELRQELIKMTPLGRIGKPMDAARLIRFLASDEAEWITGQIIHSRGGL